jgi:hypothetical protein
MNTRWESFVPPGRAIAFVADGPLVVDGFLDVSAKGKLNGPGASLTTSAGNAAIDPNNPQSGPKKGGGGGGGRMAGAAGGTNTTTAGAANGLSGDTGPPPRALHHHQH